MKQPGDGLRQGHGTGRSIHSAPPHQRSPRGGVLRLPGRAARPVLA
ncbi:hypothetical protein [Streptomyces lavendofoliae]|nr:hypothetical protein [Streptomyces lavendofoliae]